MKTVNLQIRIEEYDSMEELQAPDRELLEKAWQACDSAYAPYSKFNVGAAVLLANGKIVSGNNQENAAYPSGLCAERVAMYYASAHYPGVAMKAIAVAVKSDEVVLEEPASPCGSCRQVMAEYENLYHTKMRIILGTPHTKIQILQGISSLLPLTFHGEGLKK
ncbi:MAG: cytidine deaminase [Bacteroidetes bacterium 4572_77]|nr:MAG: cytidine deaminase [Bacteroidetes bacterium 4572_77]